MSYSSFILYKDEDVCVEWFKSGTPTRTLFITFTPATWRDLDGFGFGGEYLLKKGFDVLVIKSSWAHYWRTFGHDNLLEKIDSFLLGFYDRRIGYGSSMGALAVHLFHERLQFTDFLALSPRFVDLPNTLAKRPDSQIHEIKPFTSTSCKAYYLYDPHDKIDHSFIQKTIYTDFQENNHIIVLPFIGHPVGHFLGEMDVLDSIVMSVINEDAKTLKSLIFTSLKNRKTSTHYVASISKMLFERKRFHRAINVAEKALSMDGENMQAKIVRFDSLISVSNKPLVIQMYNELSSIRPKQVMIETLLKTRLIKIENKFGKDWLVQEANTFTSDRYQQLVTEYEKTIYGRKYIHMKRGYKQLLISMTTHNNFEKYQSLVAFSNIPYDVLFITNPSNNYYLEDDLSAAYFIFLKPFLEQYGAENVMFFGSSMAGYGALRFAIHFGANAIVCNAQVDFHITKELCWPNLRATIDKIKTTENITQMTPLSNTYVHFAYGQHPMDLANYEAMHKFSEIHKDLMHVHYASYPTKEHSYLFGNVNNFLQFVEQTFELRSKEP